MEIIIKKDGSTLGIGVIPGRKRKALYRMHGCQVWPIAYFATDEDAEWVEWFLGELCEMTNLKDTNPPENHVTADNPLGLRNANADRKWTDGDMILTQRALMIRLKTEDLS